jgi:hypothetical protein
MPHSNHLKILNQFFELEKKMQRIPDASALQRPLDRIRETFEEMGYRTHNPLGEPYNETRTDVEASIVGNNTRDLVVTDVIKPIIYFKEGERMTILQKGIVICQKP